MFGVGIIGCGLIGQKRARAIEPSGRLVACCDLDIDRANAVAGIDTKVVRDWQRLVEMPEVDIVVVATLHDSLAEMTSGAVMAGKHVLVEKPGARNPQELKQVTSTAEHAGVKVRVGFNHRYHRPMQKAKELIDSGSIGDLMFIRGRYGHGGRVGYEKEWRAIPELSGGGELLDQGPHLIDLSRWYLGEEFNEVVGHAGTFYWDMPVEDNGFMLLRTETGRTAFLHVSCTEWKNIFSLEIYGRKGKLEIFGLGGSYGVERLTWYRLAEEMGPPDTTIWEYPMEDNSWSVEVEEFFRDIQLDRQPTSSLDDAYQVLRVIEKIYTESDYDYRAQSS